jgi:hypothetical protein
MTTTFTTGVTFVQAATMVTAHLADHTPPEPTALRVNTRDLHSDVTAQLHATTAPTVARDLLAWADTVPAVTAQAWRVPAGDRAHLSITSTLTGPTGTIELDVFGAGDYHPVHLPDLQAGNRRTMSLGQLRAWATFNVPRDPR